MLNQDKFSKICSSISKEHDINDKKDLFFILINCFLISKLRTKKDNGDDILRTVYPYLLNDNINYDSNSCIDAIDFFDTSNDEDILGYIYEKSIPKNDRKDYGQFYTRSTDVVNYMINLIQEDLDNLKILEPSCGSGLFIVELIKRKIKLINDSNVEEILIDIFTNIYANDLDSLACKITEANILTSLIKYIKMAYEKNNNFTLPKLNITNIDFCNYTEENKFDLVISNPPYVTMYGRRSRNMTEEKRSYFNTFDFVRNKKGNNKFNMIMFFIEKGLKSLKENGKLVFIIDISFFETAYIDMRKYILENTYIESITTNLNEFEDVASGQIIISLIKKQNTNKTKWIDYKEKTEKLIDQDIWYNESNDYKIYVPLSDYEKSIDSKMNKHKSLDYYFPGKALRTCCALTGRTDDFIVSKDKKTDNIIFPYLEGSKGIKSKFAQPSFTRYIEYDYDLQIKISDEFKVELEKLGIKNKKRVTLGDKDFYLSPKIFIRQSANEIIATYTEENFAANNSIYILSYKSSEQDKKDMLKYTCALLNSNLITFYSKINNIIRSGNGKTPQIKTSDLKKIKIAVDKNKFNEIIKISDNLLNNYSTQKMEELNRLVYDLYEINEN